MSKPWICYVTSRSPFPPVSGAERRVYQHLVLLQQHYRVALLTSPVSLEEKAPVLGTAPEEPATVVDKMVVSKGRGTLDHLVLPFASPLQVRRAYDRSLHQLVRNAETELRPRAVIYSLVRTAPYLEGRTAPAIVDFCDALSMQFRRRSRQEAGALRKGLFASESKLLARYERHVLRAADTTMITTARDAAELGGEPNVIPVSYDLNEPTWESAPEDVAIADGRPRIIFNGDMSTRYSEAAVLWFTEKVFPLVRRAEPRAQFIVVGRNPTAAIKRQEAQPGVCVTGSVRAVAPYLASSDVAVVPLMSGTGIKGKMLEAFAAQVPVVATSIADEGMNAAAAGAVSVADEPAEFAALILQLVRDAEFAKLQVGRAGSFADQRYGKMVVQRQLNILVDQASKAYSDRTMVRSS